MALATTTLSSKVGPLDQVINVASNTSIGVGRLIIVGGGAEIMQVRQDWGSSLYPASGTVVPVLRARHGTYVPVLSSTLSHPSGAQVVHGIAATDFPSYPPGVADAVTYPAQAAAIKYSYGASGALVISASGVLPGGVGSIHELIGTSALTMTIAAPDATMDGQLIIIISNGKGAHVIQPSGNNGIGNAGAGYRNVTFTTGSKQALTLIACNGDWLYAAGVLGGTTTALQGALS